VYRNEGDILTSEQKAVRRRLSQTVISVADTNEFMAGYTGEITNPDGVTYILKDYGKINGHRQARLWIRFAGHVYGTNAIYSFGNARIHATPEILEQIAANGP